MAHKIEIEAIGTFKSDQVQPYEAGRQPDEFHSEGCIELFAGSNFEQALMGLEGCEYIWVLFQFHHNPNWNPMVLPPRGRDTKIGVFATRSPYRPNGIGMSCVRVERIDKLKIYVAGADILDGSPIIDIKPYVAYADSIPGAEPEWLKNAERFEISVSPLAEKKISWLESHGVSQLRGFIRHQLEYEPTNSKKKRVKAQEKDYILAYRTWRVQFQIKGTLLEVSDVFSGYSDHDLKLEEDTYSDKDLHRLFLKTFI
ncbi:tRNA-Thr(GGU) m(6)t(6)A37 methyltransferase TsaA [Bdellovibrio bacteriovorus]|uniref:tRNA-Thr(GGU) m(6)t(6)A37 methyltransferase TsaA n=1 Tax=Bdellovibrio bacteriovorus TaxID=959 RepID=A0A150WLY9_BDEBC|nr:tRNA (N6-threonylcarbamoyladenosine(37)-N6)-methyltransferase TrmO [Bdellovibrio bacteriovorus]KYG64990.1 tRNA-Thr(GGU) m(6)t(6)A37 methyltransferase TsaA [Bdellovibrio bacteriovorus]